MKECCHEGICCVQCLQSRMVVRGSWHQDWPRLQPVPSFIQLLSSHLSMWSDIVQWELSNDLTLFTLQQHREQLQVYLRALCHRFVYVGKEGSIDNGRQSLSQHQQLKQGSVFCCCKDILFLQQNWQTQCMDAPDKALLGWWCLTYTHVWDAVQCFLVEVCVGCDKGKLARQNRLAFIEQSGVELGISLKRVMWRSW